MSRSRNIKPSFFTNDTLAECEPLARLLFAGLWTISDREGRLEDRPKKIRAEILPYDICDAENLLQQLVMHGFIVRYVSGENKFIQILNFAKHQNPHMKESASTIPAPDSNCATPVQNVPLTDSPILIPDSPILIPDSPKREPVKKPVAEFILPEWVFSEVWDGFMEVRKKLGAADTLRAKNSIINQLEKFRSAGHDPTAIIEKSIRNSWKDVFEPKGNNYAAAQPIKPTFKSEGQRLAAKYRQDAEREEQSTINGIDGANLCIAESLR